MIQGSAKKRRMNSLQEQLAMLRQRVAGIDRRFAANPPVRVDPTPPLPRPAHRYVEEWLTGEEVETAFGRHFETEKLYERHRRHGSSDIGSLADLPCDLLDTISGDTLPESPPAEWAFLDTETTGLAGGTGTCA